MRVLVIGGAGHVARVARPGLEAAYEVRYLDRVPVPDAGQRGFVGDVEDEALVREAVQGVDAVIYLAMGMDENGSIETVDPAFNINVRGVYRAGSIALAEGVRTLVYASSISVFRLPRSEVPIDERTPPTAHGVYGLTKLLGEHVLAGLSRRYPSATLLTLRLYRPVSEEQWPNLDRSRMREPESPLGPSDTRRLFVAAAALRKPGYHVAHATGDVEGKRYPQDQVRALLGWAPEGR